MEIKKFKDYTPEEQKELLIHWFVYYGKEFFNIEDLRTFEGFIKTNAPELFAMAMLGFANMEQVGFSFPLTHMRQGNLDLLFEAIPDFKTFDPTETEEVEFLELLVVTELVTTYLNPKPGVPMTAETMEQQAEAIRADQKRREIKKMH